MLCAYINEFSFRKEKFIEDSRKYEWFGDRGQIILLILRRCVHSIGRVWCGVFFYYYGCVGFIVHTLLPVLFSDRRRGFNYIILTVNPFQHQWLHSIFISTYPIKHIKALIFQKILNKHIKPLMKKSKHIKGFHHQILQFKHIDKNIIED